MRDTSIGDSKSDEGEHLGFIEIKNDEVTDKKDETNEEISSEAVEKRLIERVDHSIVVGSICRRLDNPAAVKDCQQQVRVKLFRHFRNNPGFIPYNEDVFFWRVVNSAVIEINKEGSQSNGFKRKQTVCLDDDAARQNLVSDGGKAREEIEDFERDETREKQKAEREKVRLGMRSLLIKLPEEQQELEFLSYTQGLKPEQIIEKLCKNPSEDEIKRLKKLCNLASQNFRFRLRKYIAKLPEEPRRRAEKALKKLKR